MLIRPGTRIPVDGRVISGNSSVEEAAITGEPLPQDKLPSSRVFAGTLNQTGAIEVLVESLGRDTTFGKIVEAVEKAEQTRGPIQRLADRLAGYLVHFALGSALLTLLLTHNLRSTISVIIVAGACGIAAGTPLAILGAIGRAARQGAILKGGIYLEQLAKIDTVLLDKTGTLTLWETASSSSRVNKRARETGASGGPVSRRAKSRTSASPSCARSCSGEPSSSCRAVLL